MKIAKDLINRRIDKIKLQIEIKENLIGDSYNDNKKYLENIKSTIQKKRNRIYIILRSKNYLSKDRYTNNELLNELDRFQNDLLSNNFRKENISNLEELCNFIKKKKNLFFCFNEENKIFKSTDFDYLLESLDKMKRSVSNIKSGKYAEKETLRVIKTFSDKNKYLINNRISVIDKQDGKCMYAENDIVFICKKGIFSLEIKNSLRDLIIDEKGNLIRTGYQTKEDVVQQCLNHVNITRRALEEEIYNRYNIYKTVDINPIIVVANNNIEVTNKNKRIPMLLKNEIQDYIFNKFKSEKELSDSEINLYYEILLNRDVGPASFINNINVNKLINELATFIGIYNNYNYFKQIIDEFNYKNNCVNEKNKSLKLEIDKLKCKLNKYRNRIEIINKLEKSIKFNL